MNSTNNDSQKSNIRALIIGSGFAGLCAAIKLKRAGFNNFTILEAADRLGGTWRDNTYPGSGCDVPSFMYSFSFEPNSNWSRKYSPQSEILQYMEHCAEKYGLGPHLRFNARVAEASFDEAEGLWRVKLANGEDLSANFLIGATGQLNRPFMPSIPGREAFKGKVFHSARWDHDYPLEGKRVAVIGNGASAIQFTPIIAKRVERLTIFQRSPYWVAPKPDRPYRAWERALLARSAMLRKLYRLSIYLALEARWPVFASDGMMGRCFAWVGRRDIEKHIGDPELRKALTPDFPIGCKRILLASDYYETLNRDNVELVTSPIAKITERGLETKDGRSHEADAIIYATGFEATNFLPAIDIRGRGGRSLRDAWSGGASAYLGVAVAGFPNFFVMYGPNTNLGHNSIIYMIECQTRYILEWIKLAAREDLRYVDVKPEAMDAYNEQIQRKLGRTVWSTGCSSWYKNESGRITNNWAYNTFVYRWMTRYPRLSEFEMVDK